MSHIKRIYLSMASVTVVFAVRQMFGKIKQYFIFIVLPPVDCFVEGCQICSEGQFSLFFFEVIQLI